ncbi:hypothetical protein CLIB1423_13S02520 [[Candida] railenensis]|uniref:Uncharacterized protein n=1 Tax=[Candida] railenensis TaxID=45579 RepID=A0A9P0QS66_9ASCO|nr:hypothetical protein CLIB1423_13S02520 [[Candida] railenensis]
MSLIILSHPSTFVSYVVAYTILNFYKNSIRQLQIVIVEHQQHQLKNNINHDLSPWCGLTTLNNNHFLNKQFMDVLASHIIFGSACSIPLLSIRNSPTPAMNFNVMEKPQQKTLEVVIADLQPQFQARTQTNVVGFLYHPILLMNDIRGRMLGSGKVIFTSPLHGEVDGIVQQFRNNNAVDEVVVLDFFQNQDTLQSSVASHFLVYSNLFNIQYQGTSSLAHQQPRVRHPATALWLPSFKAITNSNGEHLLSYETNHNSSRTTTISIQTNSYNPIREEIVAHLDLLMALGTGDFVLQVINQVLQGRRISSVL